jgi:hypothetical protein
MTMGNERLKIWKKAAVDRLNSLPFGALAEVQ